MRFAPTEDQLALAEGIGDLLKAECTPEVVRAAMDAADGRVPGLWAQLAEMGVLALEVPEAAGGLGFGPMEMGLVMEAAGRVALPEPLMSTAAVAAPILAASDAPPATAWLERLTSGATVALSLSGQATVHAGSADGVLIQVSDQLHIVDASAVAWTATQSVDRARPLAFASWTPTDDSTLVGGSELVAAALGRAALASASQLLGLSETMISMTVGYAAERKQFGVAIGTFQAIKHHLANAELAVSFARPVVRRAAYSLAMGDPDAALHISMAKAAASDAAHRIGQLTLQCHGAIAYTVEYDHQLYLKKAWALAARYGDAGYHREQVAKRILD